MYSPSATATITDADQVVRLTVINERISGNLPPTGLNDGISLTAATILALGLFLLVTARSPQGRGSRPGPLR